MIRLTIVYLVGIVKKNRTIKTLKVQTWFLKISPENYPWRNPFFRKVKVYDPFTILEF